MTPDAAAPSDDRDVLRDQLRTIRRDIGPSDRADAAHRVAQRAVLLLGNRAPGRVGSYLPTDGEIDPTLAVDELRDRGWTTLLPIVRPGRTMWFAPWDGRAPLQPNRYGIDEPVAPAELVEPTELDVVFVPCVGVDPRGNRLGFGAGYYDRAFRTEADPRHSTLLIGVVFDSQIVAELERHDWDVPLDVVLSESATMPTGARPRPS